MGGGRILLKPRRDDSFKKSYRMSLISAGSISLDSTFKWCFLTLTRMIRNYSTTQLFQFSAKKIENTYYDKSILKTPLINPDIVKIKILDRDRGQKGPLHTE